MSESLQRGLLMLVILGSILAAWWVLRPAPPEPSADGWLVETVYDGDTLLATKDGVEEKVRLIGIDSPEIDACGYGEARSALNEAVLGQYVTLVGGAEADRDQYGRLLRYVELDGEDLGLRLIEEGLAAARFDSRTGQPHDREDAYRDADDASADLCASLQDPR